MIQIMWLEYKYFEIGLKGLLDLSQKVYINKVLEKFKVDKSPTSYVPIKKKDNLSPIQCSN